MKAPRERGTEFTTAVLTAATMALLAPLLYGLLYAAAGRLSPDCLPLAFAGFEVVEPGDFWVVAPGAGLAGAALAWLLRHTEGRLYHFIRRASRAGMVLGPINVLVSQVFWLPGSGSGRPGADLTAFVTVAVFGVIPGAFCGAVLGAIAGLVNYAILQQVAGPVVAPER